MTKTAFGFVVVLLVGWASPSWAQDVVATDVAAEVGIYEITTSYSIAVNDFDRDGIQDFLLVRHLEPARLYRNDGGHFTEAATFGEQDRHDCAWADVNRDGHDDVYCSIGAEHGAATVKANELWIQQPDHTFVDRAAEFGVTDPYGRGRRIAFVDVNHDPYPDLFVGNAYPRRDEHPSPNRLFVNRGGTRFREAPRYGLTEEVGARCAEAADFDDDGWQDLLVCGKESLRLYRNEEGERFADVSASADVGGRIKSARLVDVDGDARLDLVQVRRHVVSVRLQRGGAFGVADFSLVLEAGATLAVGDVNRDAGPDIYLVLGCGSKGQNLPDVVLVNQGGAAFERVDVPQAEGGCGDVAAPIDHDLNGTTDFIVANGRGYIDGERVTGPVQLVSFGP